MKPVVVAIGKVLAILLALFLLAGYVSFRQGIGLFAKKAPEVTFEFHGPESPELFGTSKSGMIVLPSKAEQERARIKTLVKKAEGIEADFSALSIDGLIEQAAGNIYKPTDHQPIKLLPGSKSINMPVFSTKDLRLVGEENRPPKVEIFAGPEATSGGSPNRHERKFVEPIPSPSTPPRQEVLGVSTKGGVVFTPDDVSETKAEKEEPSAKP